MITPSEVTLNGMDEIYQLYDYPQWSNAEWYGWNLPVVWLPPVKWRWMVWMKFTSCMITPSEVTLNGMDEIYQLYDYPQWSDAEWYGWNLPVVWLPPVK